VESLLAAPSALETINSIKGGHLVSELIVAHNHFEPVRDVDRQ